LSESLNHLLNLHYLRYLPNPMNLLRHLCLHYY
jgi:hypothetical protein